ncbi:MAG TPA: UDP-3-O-(3-hydroxymyristoyl)glucosamine N-acyltransferase [Methylomirabilota bacterium]|nr:UDP-3-O-(3-hydroxymyristoyl)glucosamine N-acyltransferase [Methylomirabilota bacterium]
MAKAGFTLGELAEALQARLDGDPARVVVGVAPLDSAGPDQISFLTDPRYREAARVSRAGAFLVPPDVADLPGPMLRCAAPQQALIDLLHLFHPPVPPPPGVDRTAVVAAGARVDPTATVGPLCVIETAAVIGPAVRLHALVHVGAGVEIGEATVVYPQVSLRDGVRVGRRVVIHAGAVLGADGFGFAFDGSAHRKIPQVGGVVIEDDVEIGANTTIDRGTFADTVVRRGTKIDNLVQIGHNVEVGEHSLLAGQVGIAGSSRLGRGVVLAGQVGVSHHVTLGDGVTAGGQTGIPSDLEPGARVWGTPARPIVQLKRIMVAEGRLPELLRRVRALEQRLERLAARLGGAQ